MAYTVHQALSDHETGLDAKLFATASLGLGLRRSQQRIQDPWKVSIRKWASGLHIPAVVALQSRHSSIPRLSYRPSWAYSSQHNVLL